MPPTPPSSHAKPTGWSSAFCSETKLNFRYPAEIPGLNQSSLLWGLQKLLFQLPVKSQTCAFCSTTRQKPHCRYPGVKPVMETFVLGPPWLKANVNFLRLAGHNSQTRYTMYFCVNDIRKSFKKKKQCKLNFVAPFCQTRQPLPLLPRVFQYRHQWQVNSDTVSTVKDGFISDPCWRVTKQGVVSSAVLGVGFSLYFPGGRISCRCISSTVFFCVFFWSISEWI